MDIRLVVLLLILIPLIAVGALYAAGAMNSLWVVLVGGVMIYLVYTLYARRIDKNIMQTDAKKATPAKMYMDGVDFMPTSKNVLYGYHFKSVTAAGPITGVITAAAIWGWFPAMLWLILGVTFIGWAADYSAIMISVRNDGNSLSAIAHRLIAPRTRTILFIFIFFYLLIVAAAFLGLLTAIMAARPDVPFGILILALMGLLAGQMLYKWKMDLIVVTVVTVIITLLAMGLGPLGVDLAKSPVQWTQGPISGATTALNGAVDSLSGNQALLTIVDPTAFDPRVPAPGADGKRPTTTLYDAATGNIKTMPSYVFWGILLLVFCFLGSNLPIWRFAQPVNYIGFWIMLIVFVLSAVGAVLAPFLAPQVSNFVLKPILKPDWGFTFVPGKAYQPLWPMLFVTIACGAISGWHSLVGSVNTSRQLEFETDALPVGGGGMLSENAVGLMSLIAASITGLTGVGGFAAGMGNLMGVLFGAASVPFATAIAYGTFIVVVITVTQLIFRVMRVTLTEWVGDVIPVFKNVTVSTVFSMLLTFFLVLTSTFVYLYQLFGTSNQLMAALGLLLVTIWLRSVKRNPLYAAIPMIFMYITTMVALIVNIYNQWTNVLTAPAFQGQIIVQLGGWFMLIVSALLFVAAAFIAWDGWAAWQRYSGKAQAAQAPAK